jgi:hypothetical protein
MNVQNLIVFFSKHTYIFTISFLLLHTNVMRAHNKNTNPKTCLKKDQHIFLLSQTTNTKNVKLYVFISFQQHKKFQTRYPYSRVKEFEH